MSAISKPRFYFFVGPPGVGKTTLVRALLEAENFLNPSPKWTIGKAIVAAGHYSGQTFDGADTVPYNGAADALAWWEANLWDRRVTIFDGDRFSNEKSLAWARRNGQALVVSVEGSESLLAARRAQRGSQQNATWAKGRATKATNFAQRFDADDALVLLARAETPAETLAAEVKRWRGWA